MSWTEEKVNKLKELWTSGKTAREIASVIGGVSRNAVIGKIFRLNLSAKIKKRSTLTQSKENFQSTERETRKRGRRSKFRSIILSKDFEPAKNLQLEELTENTCKYMEGHPDEKESSFCGRKNVEKFSY